VHLARGGGGNLCKVDVSVAHLEACSAALTIVSRVKMEIYKPSCRNDLLM